MNIYDTANKLAYEIKNSEEYVNYKMAKEVLKMNPDLKNRIDEFEKVRYQAQIQVIQTGIDDQEKIKQMQEIYVELIENADAKKYFESEIKFNMILADVNKIISEAVKDIMQ